VIARDWKTKAAHHGDAEARRAGENRWGKSKNLPLINTDDTEEEDKIFTLF
jgi:hypothetical protein